MPCTQIHTQEGRFLELTHTNDLCAGFWRSKLYLEHCSWPCQKVFFPPTCCTCASSPADAVHECNLETDGSDLHTIHNTYCPICCLWRALRPASWRFLIYVFLTAAGDPGMLIFYLNRLRYILTPPNRNNAIEIVTESVDEIHVRCLRKLLINWSG